MFKRWVLAAALSALAASPAARAADLTATELSWLEAALPVLAFARREGLPLDLIVQPQATPDETPLGMAFVDGRCKLVLSMRGNPLAKAMLDSIAPDLLGPVVEAVVAHEVAHCWRHVARRWGSLPATASEADLRHVTTAQAELLREMWQTRREEAFADLVGLAWTLRQHPARYAEVHAWQMRFRADPPLETGPHDTRVWLRLAADRSKFRAAASIFEQVESLWLEGLREGT